MLGISSGKVKESLEAGAWIQAGEIRIIILRQLFSNWAGPVGRKFANKILLGPALFHGQFPRRPIFAEDRREGV
ncbi:MAG: hypothetical protein AMJ94_01780 [Deltaproteobacteria bacterium SM23_61]|nr:MAG: hypothetical protein AMJ94_01780 [Deltaproteobacteria bacterium SM23_61]